MQCLLYAPWCPGDLITQTIIGKRIQSDSPLSENESTAGGLQKWHINSEFEIKSDGAQEPRKYKMATYEWLGYQHPLTEKLEKDGNGTIYSFLEDWNCSPKAYGHMHQRSVIYINPS